MSEHLTSTGLLPDLPEGEPWSELRFQLAELGNDIRRMLEKLQPLGLLLGMKAESRGLASMLGQLHDEVEHDATAHAPRAVLLARHLLMEPGAPVPEWDFVHELDNVIPPEVLACSSLTEAQAQVARHMEEALAALHGARQAVLSAVEVRGPVQGVLEHVLAQAMLCEQLMRGPARTHAREAWCWAQPYWRLMDPEAAAAEDARQAAVEAELATIEAEPETG
jgi:hypothetical protein